MTSTPMTRNPIQPLPAPPLRCQTWLLALLLACGSILASDLKLEAQLIWGTNEPKSPNPQHKPAEVAVAKKLSELPFKWTHYFEVNRKEFTVPQDQPRRIAMSEECEISVRQVENDQVEVILYGKGKRVGRITQKLPKGEMLVLGGNAPNYTAWFVVLQRKN